MFFPRLTTKDEAGYTGHTPHGLNYFLLTRFTFLLLFLSASLLTPRAARAAYTLEGTVHGVPIVFSDTAGDSSGTIKDPLLGSVVLAPSLAARIVPTDIQVSVDGVAKTRVGLHGYYNLPSPAVFWPTTGATGDNASLMLFETGGVEAHSVLYFRIHVIRASTDARLTSAAGVAVTTAATGTLNAPELVSISVPSSKPSITTSDIVPAPDASFHIYSDAGFSQNRDSAVILPSGESSHVYVKVLAQDGLTESYYDVTAARPGTDAGLTSVAGMGVSTAGSGASISSPQTAAVVVDKGKSSLSASEVICSAGATVTVYTDKDFSAPVQSIALNPGDYT
ncbi:MAG: hypothetical protein LBR61_09435, partial [Synergistaceae bacterium]|nr:hypothetical protein [Synergistaceae bacterium]